MEKIHHNSTQHKSAEVIKQIQEQTSKQRNLPKTKKDIIYQWKGHLIKTM